MRLAIDTALSCCSVALIDGSEVRDSLADLIGRGHSERLMPMIAELFDRSGIQSKDLERIEVDVGPGSFTGLRVGIAAARALAIAWKIPAFGFTSLSLAAASARSENEAVDQLYVAIDASRGQLYCQTFEDGARRPSGPIEALDPEIALGRAQACQWVAGSGARVLHAMDRSIQLAGPQFPSAAAASLLSASARSLDPHPLYVRAPDARLPR